MWGLHVSCLLKSTLTLLHKHAYTHTNTSTHTVITDTERLQIPYNSKFVNEFLSALSTENSFLNCLMLTSGSILALSKRPPNDQRCAFAYTAACSRQALLHMQPVGTPRLRGWLSPLHWTEVNKDKLQTPTHLLGSILAGASQSDFCSQVIRQNCHQAPPSSKSGASIQTCGNARTRSLNNHHKQVILQGKQVSVQHH